MKVIKLVKSNLFYIIPMSEIQYYIPINEKHEYRNLNSENLFSGLFLSVCASNARTYGGVYNFSCVYSGYKINNSFTVYHMLPLISEYFEIIDLDNTIIEKMLELIKHTNEDNIKLLNILTK